MRYTLEVHQAFVDAVAKGAPIKTAAPHVGIGWRTAFRWLARGEAAIDRWEAEERDEGARADDPDWDYAQFFRDVEAARGHCMAGAAAVVVHAALGQPAEYDQDGNCVREEVKPDPRMALEFLMRRDRENWARELATPTDAADAVEMDALAARGEELVRELAERSHS